MKDKTIRKLVLSAMFAALSCAATMVIQIPIATGYLNFGDGLCLLAGWILGPWYGFAAAGLGSALADLLAVLLEQAVCRVPGLMRPSGKNCT